jgi:hypothetical protein
MVTGDFNAKISKEEICQDTVGQHSLHENTNDNGQRVTDFAVSKDLVVSSTYFPHRDIHKYTWTSPDGTTHNQLDHVLTERRNASSIMDIRTYQGADCGPDYHLVKAVYRCRAQKCKYHPQEPKTGIGKLKIPDKLEAYQTAAKGKLEERGPADDDIEKNWGHIKQGILEAAKSTLEYRPRPKRNERYDEECEKTITMRNQAHKIYIQRST